jgi:hypothetical protein
LRTLSNWTINSPPAKYVRYYYTNAAALATARSGKALPDGSSIFVEVYDAKLDGKNNAITDQTTSLCLIS